MILLLLVAVMRLLVLESHSQDSVVNSRSAFYIWMALLEWFAVMIFAMFALDWNTVHITVSSVATIYMKIFNWEELRLHRLWYDHVSFSYIPFKFISFVLELSHTEGLRIAVSNVLSPEHDDGSWAWVHMWYGMISNKDKKGKKRDTDFSVLPSYGVVLNNTSTEVRTDDPRAYSATTFPIPRPLS